MTRAIPILAAIGLICYALLQDIAQAPVPTPEVVQVQLGRAYGLSAFRSPGCGDEDEIELGSPVGWAFDDSPDVLTPLVWHFGVADRLTPQNARCSEPVPATPYATGAFTVPSQPGLLGKSLWSRAWALGEHGDLVSSQVVEYEVVP